MALTEEEKQQAREFLRNSRANKAIVPPENDIANSWEAFDKASAEVVAKKRLIEQASQPKQEGFLEKVGNSVDKVMGPASNFLFGNFGKTAGSLITGGLGAAADLAGKDTILGADTKKLQQQADEAITPKAIANTVLEGTVSGLGEKTVGKIVGKLSAPLVARAEKIYTSALKPKEALLKKSPDVVKTGIKEGVRVTQGGLEKARGIIEDIGDDIGKVIDQGVAEGKTVVKEKLLPYLDEMKEYLGNSLGGKQMVKEIDDYAKNLIDELPENIPIEQAQKIKQTTQQLVAKYYNKLAPVEIETKKQLARGLKEEIAKEVPEIAGLNARDSKLIGLEKALEDAMRRMGNREAVNAFDVLTAVGGAAASASNPVKAGGTVLLIKKIFQSPALKSQAAITINKLADNGAKLLKAGRYPAALVVSKILQLIGDEEEDAVE